MAIPLPAPVPCSASFSPNKARSHRPTRVKISCPCQTSLPNDLSKLIIQDSIPMAELGWEGFVNHLRDRGNLDSLLVVPHPSHCLICQYKHQCAPSVLAGGYLDGGGPSMCAQVITTPVHAGACPFPPQEFCLHGGKGPVGCSDVLGCSESDGPASHTSRIEGGEGPAAAVAERLHFL